MNKKKILAIIISIVIVVLLFIFSLTFGGKKESPKVSVEVESIFSNAVSENFVEFNSNVIPLKFSYPEDWSVSTEVVWNNDTEVRYLIKIQDDIGFSLILEYTDIFDLMNTEIPDENLGYTRELFGIDYVSDDFFEFDVNGSKFLVSKKGGTGLNQDFNLLKGTNVQSQVDYFIFQDINNAAMSNTNLFIDDNSYSRYKRTNIVYSINTPAPNLSWQMYRLIIPEILKSCKYIEIQGSI